MDAISRYRSAVRRSYVRVFWMCAACVLLNVALSGGVALLGLPIWMDTPGTILAAVMGGYLPGIFVGLVTNILKGAADFSSIYYAVLNVLIAVCAAFLHEKGFLRRPRGIVLFVLSITAIGGGIGSILPRVLTSFATEGIALDLWHDLVDKTVTTALVIAVLRLLPADFRHSLRFRGWRQAPLAADDLREIRQIKCRSFFLSSKIKAILIVALVALTLVATAISLLLYRTSLVDGYANVARGVAEQAAMLIDPERIDDYIAAGDSSAEYRALEERLALIRGSSTDIKYLYVYRIEEDGCRVVFDLDAPDTEGSAPGELVPFDESFKPLLPKLFAGEEIEPIVTNESYGWLLTVYRPVKDSAGRCVCYVGTDVSMSLLANNELNFFTQMVFLFLGFVVLIMAVVAWFVDYNILYPINSITIRASEFAYNGDAALERNVHRLRRLDIHTGDEVENLYHAILKMTEDTMGYVAEIVSSAQRIARINNTFGKAVAPQVRDYLLSDNPDLGGTDLEVTVMFCDIRGFTSISEKHDPKEIVSTLNRYFTLLEKPIAENGGIINKYIGDAIMAVFGAPLPSKTHARDALRAARGMREALAAFNAERRAAGEPEIGFGIGLNSGKVLAGNIGTANRLEYTVIGDAVNTASRIESLCKTYSVDLLVSQRTVDLLPEDEKLSFVADAEIRGKKDRIRLYS